MQSDTVDAEHGIASGRFPAHIHSVAAVFDRIHLDCIDIDADAGRTPQMDSLGFVAQFHTAAGNHCVHNYSVVFRSASECGKIYWLHQLMIDYTQRPFDSFAIVHVPDESAMHQRYSRRRYQCTDRLQSSNHFTA